VKPPAYPFGGVPLPVACGAMNAKVRTVRDWRAWKQKQPSPEGARQYLCSLSYCRGSDLAWTGGQVEGRGCTRPLPLTGCSRWTHQQICNPLVIAGMSCPCKEMSIRQRYVACVRDREYYRAVRLLRKRTLGSRNPVLPYRLLRTCCAVKRCFRRRPLEPDLILTSNFSISVSLIGIDDAL
jgi:hypothetical protein